MTEHKRLSLRLAQPSERDQAMKMIRDGKAFMLQQKLEQWSEDYPSYLDIDQDMEQEKAYFLCVEDCPAAYLCIDFDGEAAYSTIEGRWLTESKRYMVIHRLAIDASYRGQGLGSAVFALAEDLCREKAIGSIRVDTHKENQVMQHLIRKAGFAFCGLVYYEGSPRDAFEKLI
ncbi:MAG: GNAT family N-acetyltransferase [Oscillospiraceae bacterium]|nr:GNAT family N-acetyltransferase [Oscillospiraceae bacterium]